MESIKMEANNQGTLWIGKKKVINVVCKVIPGKQSQVC